MTAYAKGDDKKLLETFKGYFKQVSDVETKQRQREKEDLKFQVGEYQWDQKAYAERKGQQGTSGRPTLSISLTKQPMQLVKNQAAAADLGVEIHPVSERAQKEVAEKMQGLYRRIERDSNAEQVRLWGLDRAVQCGRGGWEVVIQYDEDGDDEFDQEIVIKRVLDWNHVGFDPSAQEPDCSDANWAYKDEWMALDVYNDEYGNSDSAEAARLSEDDFMGLTTQEPDWVLNEQDGKKAIRTPQVWRKKHKKTTVSLVKEGDQFVIVPKSEVGRRKVYASKVRDDITLCWYRISPVGILEREEYPGLRLIPLIPAIGNELQPFDGERRFEGMVRPARDGQQTFNYGISAATEDVGRLSKIPYIGARGQFTDPKWQLMNVRNFPFIEYETVDSAGKPAPPPAPMQIDSTKLGLSLQLAEMAKGLVQSATAVYDPSLGETPKKGQSGRAVIAQQQQSDAGTSNYLQNLANISMKYEARVVMERMAYVYDRPGRVTTILGEEDKEQVVMLNAPFVQGQDGRPVRAQEGAQGVKSFSFRGGKYSTAVSVGRSYQTRMQQGQEVWAQLMPNLPPEAQVILLPTVMRFMDTPGATDAADLMAKFRDAKFPGLVGEEGDVPTTEQLQAQLQGAQQQMQMMEANLQMAIKQLETDQAKQQATIQKAQIDNEAKLALAKMQQETTAHQDALKLTIEKMKLAFEEWQTKFEAAHDVGMAAAGARTTTMKREGGQEQEDEQGQEQTQGGSSETSQEAEQRPEAEA